MTAERFGSAWRLVLERLPPEALGRVSCVSRRLQEATRDDEVWRVAWHLAASLPFDAMRLTHVASWRALCKAGVQLRRKRPLRCEASCPDVLPCGRFLGTVSDLETEEVTAIFIRSKDFLEPLELSAVRVQDGAVLNTLALAECQVRLLGSHRTHALMHWAAGNGNRHRSGPADLGGGGGRRGGNAAANRRGIAEWLPLRGAQPHRAGPRALPVQGVV